ncbi:tRNA pseudouridine synthase C|nr:tRNA pseudouridine synthase C [Candidatus Pantoea persica]
MAVNKPAGWLVHCSWLDRKEKVVVMQTVRDQIGQHVFTAHRLDRPTSGVLLMGLSSEAGRRLAQQFEQHQMQKTYHAVVRDWLQEGGMLDYLLVEELDKIADKFAMETRTAKPAVTDYQALVWAEMAVAIGRYPSARYRPDASSLPASAASISCAVIWRTCATR